MKAEICWEIFWTVCTLSDCSYRQRSLCLCLGKPRLMESAIYESSMNIISGFINCIPKNRSYLPLLKVSCKLSKMWKPKDKTMLKLGGLLKTLSLSGIKPVSCETHKPPCPVAHEAF